MVPFAEGLVHQLGRVLALFPLVIPKPARTLVGSKLELALLGGVPDLHLGDAPQIDTTVAQRQHLVVDEEFKVAIVLVGGQIEALAVVDQFTILDRPVGVKVVALIIALGIEQSALNGLAFVIGLLLGRHGGQISRVAGAPAIPAGKVFAVEQSGEALRGCVQRSWTGSAVSSEAGRNRPYEKNDGGSKKKSSHVQRLLRDRLSAIALKFVS